MKWNLVSISFVILLPAVPGYSQFVFDTPSGEGGVLQNPPLAAISSPTLRDDELEIFFEAAGVIHRATRPSRNIPFKESAPVLSLSEPGFVSERPFLSPDGLRIYFTRKADSSTRVREIYCASRQSWDAPFGEAVPLGPQGDRPFEGLLGSLTGDELKVYLEVFPVEKGIPDQTDLAFATRTGLDEPFGPWEYLPSLNTGALETDPFVTRDDRTLFFTRIGFGTPGVIYAGSRNTPSDPFFPPERVAGVDVGGKAAKGPFLIHPGSRIYFVQEEVVENQRKTEIVFSDRVLEATYVLEPVFARMGREVFVPVKMKTTEKDASLFEFNLFFNPSRITWTGQAVPSGRLGSVRLESNQVTAAVVSVIFQSENPLRGDGTTEEILSLRFSVPPDAAQGTDPLTFVGEAKLNGVSLEPLPSTTLTVSSPLPGPQTSSWVLR